MLQTAVQSKACPGRGSESLEGHTLMTQQSPHGPRKINDRFKALEDSLIKRRANVASRNHIIPLLMIAEFNFYSNLF